MEVPTFHTSRLQRQTPPGTNYQAPTQAPKDSFQSSVSTREKDEPSISGLKKWVLAAGLTASAITGMAGTAHAQGVQQVQTQTTTQSQLPVLVLPQGTPRLDVFRVERNDVPEDYSPVGIDLGNGLFQDVKGNVSVVPFLSYGWDVAAQNFNRVDLKGKNVQRFGNTVHYNESSSRRFVFTEGAKGVDLLSTRGKTSFERNADGSLTVKGPRERDNYTVRQDGLYTRVEREGQPTVSILRSGDELRVLTGDRLTGKASLVDGKMEIQSTSGRATVTRSDNGLITEIDGKMGWSDARIVRDGDLFLGRRDRDRIQVDDQTRLAEAQARYDQVMAQLEAAEPGFAQKHPVVASVLQYAAANPELLSKEGDNGFLHGGTLLATAGGAGASGSALATGATALSLANSARALGAAALSAKAAAEAAAAAGNLSQAAALAGEAKGLAAQAHSLKDQALATGDKALNTAKVARVMMGVAGALEIVDGGLGLKQGGRDKSLVEGAVAVTQARMDQLTGNLQGAELESAMEDYSNIMRVMESMEKQADKKVTVGGLKIGFGTLMVISALLGPEAPPIIGLIGIAGTAGTSIYEHWDPIKKFVTGESDKIPTFLDIIPNSDDITITLDGKTIKK